MRRMLVISNLDVWMLMPGITTPGIGNQSLYNTLLGYAEAGWEVHFLTTSTALEEMPPIHERVLVHRHRMGLFDAYLALKRRLVGTLRPRPAGAGSGETWENLSTPSLMHYARLFRLVMGRRAARLARQLGGVQFIYGHEVFGAFAGEASAGRLGVPLVTRFQGTVLGYFADAPQRLRACRAHVAGLTADADLVIMANDGARGDVVLDRLGVPSEKVRFWMNGVVKEDVLRSDLDPASLRRRLGIGADEPICLHAGGFFFCKRIDRIIEVAARVRRQFQRFKVLLIGTGGELETCRRLADDLGLGDTVMFLGAMPHDRVMEHLHACDVVVSFYDWSNLSNSLLEACVLGKCIVTTAAGATTDLVTDGINAVVVPDHDNVEAIAAGLLRVLTDPAERARLADGARRRGRELKTWAERMDMEVREVEKMLEARR